MCIRDSPKAAGDLYKSIVKAQGEATSIFPDATSKPYKKYMKNVLELDIEQFVYLVFNRAKKKVVFKTNFN